jgi:hypothetical protein
MTKVSRYRLILFRNQVLLARSLSKGRDFLIFQRNLYTHAFSYGTVFFDPDCTQCLEAGIVYTRMLLVVNNILQRAQDEAKRVMR